MKIHKEQLENNQFHDIHRCRQSRLTMLHERRADAVFMQGKALINDNQAKASSKAVHGYLISVLTYIAFASLLHHHTHTL